MKIDIRENIRNNFKNTDIKEIKEAITISIKENKEVTLPGMGVFFEILWNNSSENEKENIVETIKKGI